VQKFERIEGLIQLLGQQTVDANNQAAAQRAAIMCGIQKGSAVEKEELSALGLKLDKLTEGVGIVINQNARQQESIDEVKELVSMKNKSLKGKALARQDKDRALEALEITLDEVEEEPFAKGGQGSVHRAEYQGDTVALKKMSLVGMSMSSRQKMAKGFATELAFICVDIKRCPSTRVEDMVSKIVPQAIMVKLRSPRIVAVFGVVTTDPSWMGLVVEFCGGGDLRTRLDAEG
jgi:hypothetical protein